MGVEVRSGKSKRALASLSFQDGRSADPWAEPDELVPTPDQGDHSLCPASHRRAQPDLRGRFVTSYVGVSRPWAVRVPFLHQACVVRAAATTRPTSTRWSRTSSAPLAIHCASG